MGTRADFYVGRGVEAEWLGSTAWDGYPSGVEVVIAKGGNEVLYPTQNHWRTAVGDHLVSRNDGTLPKDGWPWPWDDSRTTDFAYAWDDGVIYVSRSE